MNKTGYRRFLAAALCALTLCITAHAEQKAAIDPKADAALKEMSAVLAAAKTFSFESHAIADQFLDSGQKVQFARNQKVLVQRPDKFHASVTGDQEDLEFVYDGKQVSLLNVGQKRFAVADAKPTIDQTLDLLAEQYGLALPLADLIFPDPYKCLIEHVRSGELVGTGYVFGDKCRHLAFRQETVDWQIWIDEKSKLPRKIVITYKEQPAQPQYTAFLSNWNLSAQAKDAQFKFTAPDGATKEDFAAANGSAPVAPTNTKPADAGKK